MARYLFFSINNVWAYHFETEMELMTERREQGHEVFALVCQGTLNSCSSNPRRTKMGCIKCISRRDVGLKQVGFSKKNIFTLQPCDTSIIPQQFESQEALENFSIDGVNFGKAAVSMLMTDVQEHVVDTQLYATRIHEMLRAALTIARNVSEVIQQQRIDGVYFHNGRFFDYAPVVEVCKKLRVDFYVHVRAGSLNRYLVTKNHLPHELQPMKTGMMSLWQNNTSPDKVRRAEQWFVDMRNRSVKAYMGQIYTALQTKGNLPSNWYENRRNIAIFNGSLFEYGIFDDWRKSPGFMQNKVITDVIEFFKDDDTLHFYLRVHPHLKDKNNIQMQEIRVLAAKEYKNLTIIWPEEIVDTYELMEKAEKILTFGSTTGVEAAFLNKPVILWGFAFYEDLECVYRPASYEQLFSQIKGVLEPLGSDKALPYGFWQAEKGERFKHYKQTAINEGLFKGKAIAPKISFVQKLQLRVDSRMEGLKKRIKWLQ
jgi:hypothetical protein